MIAKYLHQSNAGMYLITRFLSSNYANSLSKMRQPKTRTIKFISKPWTVYQNLSSQSTRARMADLMGVVGLIMLYLRGCTVHQTITFAAYSRSNRLPL